MEKQNYRDTLAYLLDVFDGKMVVGPTEVGRAFRIDPRTARKRYPFNNSLIELTKLASYMCMSEEDVRKAYKCPKNIRIK